jgi:hypothetical protein
MKTNLKVFALLLTCLGLTLHLPGKAAQKRFALIIGANALNDQAYLKNHQKQYGHDAISGVWKDVASIQRILTPSGYECTQLTGPDANRQAILDAIKRIGAQVKAGDQFLFYYSGHGDVVRDTNGDEESGSDQVLVAYDNYVIDDELDELLRRYFTSTFNCMIIDACHSGSTYKMTSFFLDFKKKIADQPAFAHEKMAVKQQALMQQCSFNEVINEPYQLIYFGATADDALSIGNSNGGLLTISLNSIFNTARSTGQWNTYTYRKLACALYGRLNSQHQSLQYHEIGADAATFANRKPFNSF